MTRPRANHVGAIGNHHMNFNFDNWWKENGHRFNDPNAAKDAAFDLYAETAFSASEDVPRRSMELILTASDHKIDIEKNEH